MLHRETGKVFMDLFSHPPKLPQEPTASAEEGGLEIKSVTQWQDAGILFSGILSILHPSLNGLKKKESFPGQELEQINATGGMGGNSDQDLSLDS